MRMLTSNLREALELAIPERALIDEEQWGDPDAKSGMRRGFEEVLEAINRGEQIWVADT